MREYLLAGAGSEGGRAGEMELASERACVRGPRGSLSRRRRTREPLSVVSRRRGLKHVAAPHLHRPDLRRTRSRPRRGGILRRRRRQLDGAGLPGGRPGTRPGLQPECPITATAAAAGGRRDATGRKSCPRRRGTSGTAEAVRQRRCGAGGARPPLAAHRRTGEGGWGGGREGCGTATRIVRVVGT